MLIWDYSDYEHPEKVCELFGYEDSEFMYEDKKGEVGCYIDYNYIKKIARERMPLKGRKDGEQE